MPFKTTVTVALAMTLAACDTSSTETASAEKSELERMADNIEQQAEKLKRMASAAELEAARHRGTMPGAPVTTLPAATLASVCKALIANQFGHSPTIMKAKADAGGLVTVTYNRPDDGKRFTNDCQIDGETALWRSVDASPGSGPGPWRNRPEDDKITFATNGRRVFFTITYSDGSVVTESEPLV